MAPAHDPHHPPHRKRSFFGSLRASFLTGLGVILPIGLTIYFIWVVTGWIDSWVLPFIPQAYHPDTLIRYYLGDTAWVTNVRGVGVVIFLMFTILVGWVAKGIIGRSFLHWTERTVERLPIVRSVYNGVKQISDTIFNKSEKSFDTTCLVEFPRPGSWALGFVSSKPRGDVAQRLPDDDMVAVFIGLTPFTSGFLVFVPRSAIRVLDMTMEDAAKLIVSGGLVYPADRVPTQVPLPEAARAAE
jgi:uncharacterized membrane protein